MKSHIYAPFKKIRILKQVSERVLCKEANLSRMTLRHLEKWESNATLSSIASYATALEAQWGVYAFLEEAIVGKSSTYRKVGTLTF